MLRMLIVLVAAVLVVCLSYILTEMLTDSEKLATLVAIVVLLLALLAVIGDRADRFSGWRN